MSKEQSAVPAGDPPDGKRPGLQSGPGGAGRERPGPGDAAERRREVDAHRRELEECERRERECVLRKPVPPRDGKRRRRLLIVLAAAVVALAAVAVPVVMAVMRSAANAARAGIEKTTETMDAVRRVEGYLERDEARELERR